jgi:hypothetical protein
MTYVHGKVETEAKTVGTAAHEKLAEDAVRVRREDLWRKIYSPTPIFALEMFLIAKFGDTVLAGKPDAVLFRRGRPQVVFEYKFSRSDVAYPSYHVQAQTYGLLLQNMGFNTANLYYAIVVARPETKGNKEFRKEAIRTVIANGPKIGSHVIKDAKIYINKYSPALAEMDLAWAVQFWRSQRQAKPTGNKNKCAKCEYQIQCV